MPRNRSITKRIRRTIFKKTKLISLPDGGPTNPNADFTEGMEESDEDCLPLPLNKYPGLIIQDKSRTDVHALQSMECEQSDSNSNDLFPPSHVFKSTSLGITECSPQKCRTPAPTTPVQWPLIDTPPPLVVESSLEMRERLIKRNTRSDGNILEGRRVISISSFEKSMRAAMEHGKTCKKDGVLQLVKDIPQGLKSNMNFECVGCSWKYSVDTDEGKSSLPVNEALAWGTIAGGLTYLGTKHLFTILEIPYPSFNTYQVGETKSLHSFETALMRDIELNGMEEARLARANGDFVEVNGISYPFTTVEVDAAWNSRSYGHSFKSKGGVAAIIGKWTNKILFLGVRNKFCYTCKRHADNPVIPEHKCYKNYDANKSAASMESDMILEGFNCSISVHQLVYKRMIGDGDSSVYLTVLYEARYGDIRIEKVECVNHAVKRFNSKLYLLAENTQVPLLERKDLKKQINRFGKALRGAVEYNSANNLTNPALLRGDIINIPFHIYGQHDKCREYFCKPERKNEENRVPICKYQKSWQEITSIVLRAANLADRLIHNMKSNSAESFMSRVAKFNCGKRVSFIHRYGWHLRTTAAALSYNKGPHFYAEALKLSTGSSPQFSWRLQEARGIRLKEKKEERFKELAKAGVKRTRLYFGSTDTSNAHSSKKKKPANSDRDYGPNAVYPDVEHALLTVSVNDLIRQKQVSLEERDRIAKQTIGQSSSELWKIERSGRITASVAGKIFNMRDTTNNTATLNSIIHPASLSNVASLEHGRQNELHAKAAYTKQTSECVAACGLYISLENGIFAASPDGLVGDEGILEIKCPSSMIGLDPQSMPDVMKASYLRRRKTDSSLELSPNHLYYYQVVMQLYCTGRKWCDFVVYTYKEEGKTRVDFPPFIQRIARSEATDKLWTEMKIKLEKFYREDLAPELVDSRHERSMPYRQPQYRIEAIAKAADLKLQKAAVGKPTQVEI